MKICITCAAWQISMTEPIWGKCRRHAPKQNTDGHAEFYAQWPYTVHDDWCLEWVECEGEAQNKLANK